MLRSSTGSTATDYGDGRVTTLGLRRIPDAPGTWLLHAEDMRTKPTLISTAVLLVVLLIGGASGAVAGTLITGRQIKDGTVTGRDIKNGSLAAYDLSPTARTALRGRTGPAGSPGVSGWVMVQASSPSVPGNTPFQEVSATCPQGKKLMSASAHWHVYHQDQISVFYNSDGTGATAMVNDGSAQATDNIDLTLICAQVL